MHENWGGEPMRRRADTPERDIYALHEKRANVCAPRRKLTFVKRRHLGDAARLRATEARSLPATPSDDYSAEEDELVSLWYACTSTVARDRPSALCPSPGLRALSPPASHCLLARTPSFSQFRPASPLRLDVRVP